MTTQQEWLEKKNLAQMGGDSPLKFNKLADAIGWLATKTKHQTMHQSIDL